MRDKVNYNIDYASFLRRHAMQWEKKPRDWDEAPFVGSGHVGSLLYYNGKNRLTVTVGDTSVYDNRTATEQEKQNLFLTPRLPIGSFVIGGAARTAAMQMNLYDAEITGWSKTLLGTYQYRCFAPHGKKLIIFETFDDTTDCTVEWIAAEAVSPRQKYMLKMNKNRASRDYPPPQKAYSYQHKEVSFCIHPFYSGGYYVVAYISVPTETGMRLFITTGQGSKENIITRQLSYELDNAIRCYDKLRQEHLDYWHAFYSQSFISLNDAAMEEFYWTQLYKLASAGCEHGRVYDTCGPWLPEVTAWPGTWWNLNVQLTYSPLFAANHLELVSPLATTLRNGLTELIDNVPQKYRHDSAAIGRCTTDTLRAPVSFPGDARTTEETGNLLWALTLLWKYYRITCDEAFLKNTLFPLLKRAVGYYLHFLLRDKDDTLHLPATLSPEYPEMGMDANYDLALLKWGLSALLETCDTLSLNESRYQEWRWVQAHLADYPVESGKGFKIAADVAYRKSHRHYSHLMMIYPLRTFDLSVPMNRMLAKQSIENWLSKPEALQGFSFTGAASMYAMFGEGNKAYQTLSKLWEGDYISPNTMYREGGNPVMETPCAAACTVLDMLLQSENGTITVMPAVPDVWKDITFDKLLCEGGFEATAVMRDGKLLWVMLRNRYAKDGICRLCVPRFENREITLHSERFQKELQMPTEGLRLRIPQGQSVILADKTVTEFELAPVSDSDEDCHVYGFNKHSML
ncbi:MAG: hypothetical protein IJ766_10545 [Clostridia bacterium]|nr:hypothetical protein [Clostridia bacterium]